MREKDNVDLICDITERAGLFERSHSLQDFLNTATRIVAQHMKAAVCSIYLYDEAREELVLRATHGLEESAVGRVRLALGEGITGLALKELRPICENCAPQNPNFKSIPGIREEEFEAFLAVPILRRRERIGVLVVQDPHPQSFEERDVKALRAIATQLATTIENANLFMGMHEGATPESTSGALPKLLRCAGFSEGIGMGRAAVIETLDDNALRAFDADPTPRTLDDFRRALKDTEDQLAALQSELEETLPDVASLIFSAHLLILKDAKFSGAIEKKIESGEAPQRAASDIVHSYIDLFSKNPNPRLQEKVSDIRDLGHRLLSNLMAHDPDQADYEGRVIVARDLLPSELLKLAAQRAAGLILSRGGITSHLSILAQSLRLPAVRVDEEETAHRMDGHFVIIDASQGTLYIDPEEEARRSFVELQADQERQAAGEIGVKDSTYTADGVRVHLLANINLLNDVKSALRINAEGIGLYRSEFPFIVRDNFPSEEEQYRIYKKLFEAVGARPVTLRTLDIGGDKMLSYVPSQGETNPFLGLRAIRFSLRNPEVFRQQLRAMLRAGVDRDTRIMFPLISSVDEFESARAHVEESLADLREHGEAHNPAPRLGAMIELPSAVEIIDELCAEADFISVGTNDLVQYMLAVDRTNENVSDMYIPYHPAVLRALRRIAHAAQRQGIGVSICGNAAADPRLLTFLLGCGIRSFSVDPRHIPSLQPRVEAISCEQAKTVAEHVVTLSRISETTAYLSSPSCGLT